MRIADKSLYYKDLSDVVRKQTLSALERLQIWIDYGPSLW